MAGYRGLTAQGKRKVKRRIMVAITGFICGYTAQINAPIFNWNWALYAFLRSLLAMCRLLIPIAYQPEAADIYAFINGSFPYFIAYNSCYIGATYVAFFKATLDLTYVNWMEQYAVGGQGKHHHGIIPPCKISIHTTHEDSCLKSFIRDGMRHYTVCIVFGLWFCCALCVNVNLSNIIYIYMYRVVSGFIQNFIV